MSDARSDAELVEAGNRGDSAALGELYRRHRDWAASLAYRFTGEREAALDVMQEAFVYWFSRFPGFELRAKVTTFLYPVIRNGALAARRKKRPGGAGEVELEMFAAPEASGGSSVPVSEAVSRLPAGQREVLLMRAVDEMSVSEIALALGIPEGTVKSRLHHAIGALRMVPELRSYWEGDS